MTSKPTEITTREPKTLEQIATAAAALITTARSEGLTPPCALSIHDYNPTGASLFLAERDAPDIWAALQQWASRYETEIVTRPATTPGTLYASAEFRHEGINYEVYSVIHPDDDTQPQAA